MRTAMVGVLVLLGALVWATLPASAGDEEGTRIEALKAELARQKAELAVLQQENARTAAEVKHLREAYNEMSANAARASRAIEVMTNSMKASQELIAALTAARDALQVELADKQGELARLRDDIRKRPEDDPLRLSLELREERTARTQEAIVLNARIASAEERANLLAVRATEAEAKLGLAQEEHDREVADLRAKLERAEAIIKVLRAGR